jgi:hypothetical protein
MNEIFKIWNFPNVLLKLYENETKRACWEDLDTTITIHYKSNNKDKALIIALIVYRETNQIFSSVLLYQFFIMPMSKIAL